MTSIQRIDLIASYDEAKQVLIPLTQQLRELRTKLKINEMNNIFNNASLWIPQDHGSGHRKFSHKVTRVIVEYQGHSSKKDRTISEKIQKQILGLSNNFSVNSEIFFSISQYLC